MEPVKNVIYNDEYKLDCEHTAHPSAIVTWYFENKEITSNDTSFILERG